MNIGLKNSKNPEIPTRSARPAKSVYRYFRIGQVSACYIANVMTHQYRFLGRLAGARKTPPARANHRAERGVK